MCRSVRKALHVSLGSHAVLHDLTVDVGRGWTAIVGPNGAGKSTLVACAGGAGAGQRRAACCCWAATCASTAHANAAA